jgi:hypothetical protein
MPLSSRNETGQGHQACFTESSSVERAATHHSENFAGPTAAALSEEPQTVLFRYST